jgi:hypothetical protein
LNQAAKKGAYLLAEIMLVILAFCGLFVAGAYASNYVSKGETPPVHSCGVIGGGILSVNPQAGKYAVTVEPNGTEIWCRP